jgi:hypothetical protein
MISFMSGAYAVGFDSSMVLFPAVSAAATVIAPTVSKLPVGRKGQQLRRAAVHGDVGLTAGRRAVAVDDGHVHQPRRPATAAPAPPKSSTTAN